MRFPAHALLVLASAPVSNAFVVVPRLPVRSMFMYGAPGEAQLMASRQSASSLFMSEDQEDTVPASSEEETVAQANGAEDESEESVADTEAEEEDREILALKEEIASFESELKAKQRNLAQVQDNVEKYSKTGYARRVAEMEDMKRMRLSMQSSNKEAAKAAIVQNFLPVLDELQQLRRDFGQDDFGSKYSGLAGAMNAALKELGVEEYTAETNTPVNPQRVQVVEEEYNEEIPKGNIIRPVSMGMELSGNVMRLAQAVASLGSESVEEAPEHVESDAGSAPSEGGST